MLAEGIMMLYVDTLRARGFQYGYNCLGQVPAADQGGQRSMHLVQGG
jgi:hypothetical protein